MNKHLLIIAAAIAAIWLSASLVPAAQIQRSIVIQPYPQERIIELEKNISTISGPAQALVGAMDELASAKQAFDKNATPGTEAQYKHQLANAYGRVVNFVATARKTKVPLSEGMYDLADYLAANAAVMEQAGKDRPQMKQAAEYLQRQSDGVRQFADGFTDMVGQLEGIAEDLSSRASGWASTTRVIQMMEDVYGPGGTAGAYQTMASVVGAMGELKSLFGANAMVENKLGTPEDNVEVKKAQRTYEKAITDYYAK